MKKFAQNIISDAKWENWLNFFLGLWVMSLPWTIWRGFTPNAVNVISWNFFLVGLLVSVLSIITIRHLKSWTEWLIFLSGAWLFFSPWFLVYFNDGKLFWNSLIPGILISLFSGIAIPIAERKIYHRVSHKTSKDNFLFKH